ncbi:MFS transporter [Amycolatopsis benzoatilytica]|uniref:MFS transporter n=1 Tax=Amycolatopsis benzoatilytica TaxID=346045 RepID=UPI000372E759|nr:MFS transporter [Amycolatopsis benzoatilytica]
MNNARTAIRRLATAQALTSAGDGAVLGVSAVHFTTRVGLPAGIVALGLSLGAATSLTTTVPFGTLLDRIGARRALAAATVAAVASLLLFAVARNVSTYIAACALFACGQSALAAGRQAVVATVVAPEGRVRARAVLHTAVNIGIGVGSGLGALVLASGANAGTVFAVDAGLFLFATALYLHAGPDAPAERQSGWPALRDRRYVTMTVLAAVTQLTMPILSVTLPLWIVTRGSAPQWTSAIVLLANTVLVVVLQLPISRQVRDARTARRSLAFAGLFLIAACAVFGSLGATSQPVVVALIGALLLTLAETTASAGCWHLAFSLAPEGHQGQYQALFATSTALARITGPIVLVPLVLTFGFLGWTLAGLGMLTAALALAAMAQRNADCPVIA